MGPYIEPTFDEVLIRSVLFDEAIWKAIKDDHTTQENFVLDFQKNVFLRVVAEQQTAGLYILHRFNNATLQIHANILPKFREQYASSSAQAVLKYIDQHLDEQFKKLVALIPKQYAHVYHFTLNAGFSDEGCLINAYSKNGVLDDVHVLGLCRERIQEL